MSPRRFPACLSWALLSAACGGGGASSVPSPAAPASQTPASGPNVLPVTVDAGPVPGQTAYNIVFTSVTVCVPGTSSCQTIPEVQVDTGSSGLRLLSSALTLNLPAVTGPTQHALAECLQYSDSSNWGTVKRADVHLAGEQALSLPVQVIGDPSVPTVPSACTSGGFPTTDTLASLGTNGVLGVGNLIQDCGVACTFSGAANPGLYYECSSKTQCQPVAVSLAQQVQNPVALFASDNNGIVLQLPAVATEATSLQGSMIFGIGTQANNGLGSAVVFTFDANGYFTTLFAGKSLPYSFIDSGSSAIAFPDPSVATCSDLQNSLFCPSSSLNFSATNQGTNGSQSTVAFTVSNADQLFTQFPNGTAFAPLGAPALVTQAGAPNGPGSFDWGLPFFFGRSVFSAIEGQPTPAGPGPYVAY